jgi:hypothetical protein
MIMKNVAWCDEAAAALGRLIDPDLLPIFIKWIAEGVATLWRITEKNTVTWLITRIEKYPSGLELVLDAIAGKNCKQIVKILIDRAKALGIKQIRFETHHSEKLAQKFIGGLGFTRVATVFRAVI